MRNDTASTAMGRALIAQWALEPWQKPVQTLWARIWRQAAADGRHPLQALSAALSEVHRDHTPIVGIETLQAWVEHSPDLTRPALETAVEAAIDLDSRTVLEKALNWLDAAAPPC